MDFFLFSGLSSAITKLTYRKKRLTLLLCSLLMILDVGKWKKTEMSVRSKGFQNSKRIPLLDNLFLKTSISKTSKYVSVLVKLLGRNPNHLRLISKLRMLDSLYSFQMQCLILTVTKGLLMFSRQWET